MHTIFEIYSHISAVIVTLELIVMGIVVWKAWKWKEKDGKQASYRQVTGKLQASYRQVKLRWRCSLYMAVKCPHYRVTPTQQSRGNSCPI